MLKDIFYNLSKSENYFFKNIYSAYKTNKVVYQDVYDLNAININENSNVYFYTEDKIKYNEDGYKTRYYKYYNIDNIDDACEKYLDSYFNGKQINDVNNDPEYSGYNFKNVLFS